MYILYVSSIYLLYSGESRKVICGMFEQSSFYYVTSSCIYLSVFNIHAGNITFLWWPHCEKRGNNTRADYLI